MTTILLDLLGAEADPALFGFRFMGTVCSGIWTS